MPAMFFLSSNAFRRRKPKTFGLGWGGYCYPVAKTKNFGWLLFAFIIALSTQATAAEPTKDQLDFFESKIRPLLIDHCYECHSQETGESEGGLLIDSAAAILKGGGMGPALLPGRPEKSLLIRAINYRDNKLQMPPTGKLPDESISLLSQWIKMGAPDPRKGSIVEKPASPLDRDPKTHWAFVAPRFAKQVPRVGKASDLLDAFAVQAAKKKGVQTAPQASAETLVRRLYFDLTGLPPTIDQIRSFTNSDRPDAYARLVDRLLASPDFAERFGRHWLDVARYADTVGYALGGKERRIKGSDRFRDWVIRAFATDMPYDQMIMNQLAGDRIDAANKHGNLDAMGFLTIGRRFLNGLDTIDDRIDVITRGLLGMTVACARCHDHKFDPIPTADYYSLAGVFHSSAEKKDGASPLMMVDKAKPSNTHVLVRGQQGNRGPVVKRQFLTSLQRAGEPQFSDGSGRLELAKRIVADDNPLTARIMVNRVWGHLIGKPLVDSPSDFGFRTQPPAIAKILDDLAADFATHWSVKRLVRRIVMTDIYRQSSQTTQEMVDLDPNNELLTRANRRRRDFESLRDSILVTSSFLNRRMGGEPVEITLGSPSPRRSIYAMVNRQNLPSLFRTFDFASPDAHSPLRYFTTVPQQALFLLNDQQITELSRRTAQHVRRSSVSKDAKTLSRELFTQALGRLPSLSEESISVAYLNQKVGQTVATTDPRSLWSYGTSAVDDRFRVKKFIPLTVFADGSWHAAKEFPAKSSLAYASLGKENGHPGRGNENSVVRRWQAPASGKVRVIGMVGHRGDKGDGIHAAIWSGKHRIFASKQQKTNRPYGPLQSTIKKGEYLEFVASPQENDSFDSFFWRAQIKLTADDGRVFEADSVKDFSGPFDPESTKPLDRLAQLAQALLMSNEFAFVD